MNLRYYKLKAFVTFLTGGSREGTPPPPAHLFLDKTEAQRAKNVFRAGIPLISGVDEPPLSECLELPLFLLVTLVL